MSVMNVNDLIKFLKGKPGDLPVLIGTQKLVYTVEKADISVQQVEGDLVSELQNERALVIEIGAAE